MTTLIEKHRLLFLTETILNELGECLKEIKSGHTKDLQKRLKRLQAETLALDSDIIENMDK